MNENEKHGQGRFPLYLLFPFVLFLLAFAVDKLFWVGDLPSYFLRTASFVNYEHKEELIDELESYLQKKDRRKVLVIFGNSRTTSFDPGYLEKNYPDWTLYNFSVPGGTSDYYYYYMLQFQKRNIHPDYIYFALTPQGFNTTSTIALDEVMLHGLPPSFVAMNFMHYPMGDLTNYISKKLFKNYMNKPRVNVIVERMREDGQRARMYEEFVQSSRRKLKRNQGSAPYNLERTPRHESSQDLIDQARDMFKAYLNPFSLDHGQLYFTEEALRIAHEESVPAALLWPKVGKEVRRLMKEQAVLRPERPRLSGEKTIVETWKPHMIRIARKYNSPFIDMNYGQTIACDVFHDASHMAGICFHDFTDFLMQRTKNHIQERSQDRAPEE